MMLRDWPWLELACWLPLLGALALSRVRRAEAARRAALALCGATLAATLLAWWNWQLRPQYAARWSLAACLGRPHFLQLDALSAPLLPLAALLFGLTALATPLTKVRRFSFARMLVSEALLLATLGCRHPWGVVVLLAAATMPPWLELRARKRPSRVYLIHMALFVVLLVGGWTGVTLSAARGHVPWWTWLPVLLAVAVRSGIAPFHCWAADLFERATFGTALLYLVPIPGAYAASRLLVPAAPEWALHAMAVVSLATALYAAGMALVQTEARRFFCYVLLSHSALVLAGLEAVTPLSLTGALCVWLSVQLGLAGFGLSLRMLEARHGRMMLTAFHGLYEHTPTLAACFLLAGLASVGFPGTFGFLGSELLVDSAVHGFPYVGLVAVLVAALNGIAVLMAYFRLFGGARHATGVQLGMRFRERFAVLALLAAILGGGLYPQAGLAGRHRAAQALLQARTDRKQRDTRFGPRPAEASLRRGTTGRSAERGAPAPHVWRSHTHVGTAAGRQRSR